MKKHRNLFLCISFVVVTILLSFGFLAMHRVGNTKQNYFFQRIYSDNLANWEIQEIPQPNNKTLPLCRKTDIVDSVVLDDNKCIAFGPIDTTNTADYSFFYYSITNNSYRHNIVNHNILSCDYSNKFEKRLAYDGVFLKYNNHITYTFQHLPLIFVFDIKGKLLRRIHTKDNVPCPSIIRYKHLYIYERGKTFNSNISSFVNGKQLYVFSYRVPKISGRFIVDAYSIKTGEYLYSIRIGKNITSANSNIDIDKITTEGNNILIDTRDHLFKLNIS